MKKNQYLLITHKELKRFENFIIYIKQSYKV